MQKRIGAVAVFTCCVALPGCNEPEAIATDFGEWKLIEAERPAECVAQFVELSAELPPPDFDTIEYEYDGEVEEMRLLRDGVEVERRLAEDGLFLWEDVRESAVGPVSVSFLASGEYVLYVLAWQLPSNACSFGITREGRLEGELSDY